jgi:hypothetical protein
MPAQKPKAPTDADLERTWNFHLLVLAEVEDSERRDDPQFGLRLTLSGIRKLALHAPEQARAQACLTKTEKAIREVFDEPHEHPVRAI